MNNKSSFIFCRPVAMRPFLFSLLILMGLTISHADAEFMRTGDQVPDVQLVSEKNAPVSLYAEDRVTLFTFIFTRCAAMEFCPRMAKQFESLQSKLGTLGIENFRLLSISLDPTHDVPELLGQYGEAVGADPDTWNFATADPSVIDSLTHDFRVHRNNEGGVLNHTLCTVLVDTKGQIVEIFRGNRWTVEEVIAAAKPIL